MTAFAWTIIVILIVSVAMLAIAYYAGYNASVDSEEGALSMGLFLIGACLLSADVVLTLIYLAIKHWPW